MNEADQVGVYKVTTSLDWPAVWNLALETVNELLKQGLLGNRAESDDAISVARGATNFLKRFKQEIDVIQQRLGAPESQESKTLPEDTPLHIL
jgi:hypothetical protein